MPRMSGRTAVQAAPAVITASAARYPDTGQKLPVNTGTAGWQAEAWRFYDIIGELRYIADYIGNILSRARFEIEQVQGPNGTLLPNGPKVVTIGPAVDALGLLTAQDSSEEAILKAFGIHLTIAGECYLIGLEENGGDEWGVYGVTEVDHSGSGENVKWSLKEENGQRRELDNAVVIRVWRPHPRNHMMADSPVRSVLPILSEIEYLTRHIFAQVQSRLAGAGILELAQGMTFPVVPGTEGLGTADQFMQMLGEAMVRPIKDPSSPASIVPIVVTSPDDLIGKMNHTTFWSPLDEHAVELRTEAIRRLALGMEIPPEIMLGQGGVNHWSGWLIDESAIKAHIEPLLGIVTNAITVKYIRTATDSEMWRVVANTAQMRLRPDRSKEALELYDRGELDGEALRRETGFDEDDAPTIEEYRTWLLRKVAGGSATPEQVGAALALLGVDLGVTGEVSREARPDRTLDEHPVRDMPNPEDSETDEVAPDLAAASEVLVFRALERAGNKMRSLYGVRPAGVNAADLYRYVPVRNGDLDRFMEDAWSCLPQTMHRFTCDQERIKSALDSYTRSLLVTQGEHDYEKMRTFLAAAS